MKALRVIVTPFLFLLRPLSPLPLTLRWLLRNSPSLRLRDAPCARTAMALRPVSRDRLITSGPVPRMGRHFSTRSSAGVNFYSASGCVVLPTLCDTNSRSNCYATRLRGAWSRPSTPPAMPPATATRRSTPKRWRKRTAKAATKAITPASSKPSSILTATRSNCATTRRAGCLRTSTRCNAPPPTATLRPD
jgi:hypothetical protein